MIIVCQNCSTRLQVDEEKSPARPFTIRCPKCNSTVNSGPPSPASEKSALTVGGSPSTGDPRLDQPTPAPAYPLDTQAVQEKTTSTEEVIRLLADLLSKGSESGIDNLRKRTESQSRKVLVCTAEKYRASIARRLTEGGYRVLVADDTRQAVERMRANQFDIVLLEPQFDTQEQGSAFVTREINVLRPSQRRRLFFILLGSSLRTMDAHAAFLNNANAVVNLSDIEQLPKIVDGALLEYNELYRDFNSAFNLAAL
jgi:predicted Zn finger-like uncharacterized protein